MPTTLQGIANKARNSRKHCFQNLYSLLNYSNLRECFFELKKNAAPGVDLVDWYDYQVNLEDNLQTLVETLKAGGYRAKLVRRKYIPKGNGKVRPLGIPCLEDKLVQRLVAKILEAIYEQDFLDFSYGYRPGKSPQGATQDLARDLQFGPYGWVVEADIRGFFDSIDHEWMLRMLKERIGDEKLLRLICKWLKAGILETDGKIIDPETGSPQGGIISPILANVYLHYALDLWFDRLVKPTYSGRAKLTRYADDFVCIFHYRRDAEDFYNRLGDRLAKFKLSLALDKTRKIQFSRFRVGEGSFEFLGFEFRWGLNQKKSPQVWRWTARKKLRAALQRLKDWVRKTRCHRIRELMRSLKAKYQGHRNYYAVIGNSRRVSSFEHFGNSIVLKWLNRRSQRRSYNWAGFQNLLRQFKVGNFGNSGEKAA